MSASGPPTPEELALELGISPMEAQQIADAMTPLQDLTGVGSSVGSALTNTPGAGPRLVGTLLQNIAHQVNLASTSVETVARAMEFYIEAQGESLEALFPPPGELATQAGEDAQPLIEAIDRLIERA